MARIVMRRSAIYHIGEAGRAAAFLRVRRNIDSPSHNRALAPDAVAPALPGAANEAADLPRRARNRAPAADASRKICSIRRGHARRGAANETGEGWAKVGRNGSCPAVGKKTRKATASETRLEK